MNSVNESRIQPVHHYGPVTALKISGNHILCGYGPFLKVFDASSQELVASHRVFQRNKIHHIGVSPGGKVLVIGARSYAFTTVAELVSTSFTTKEYLANEWIICGEYLSETEVALLNSHNTVYTVIDGKIITTSHCLEKSLLYSGSIAKIGNAVVVAAGTVMDGVIVWDISTNKILFHFKDHLGSIFGVQINDEGTQLISCSDDRSIKLYDLTQDQGNLLSSGWGHGSRIWGLRFMEDYLVSAGEDCTLRVWKNTGSDELESVKVLENVHSGKHIWSMDAEDNMVVSGGADGKVRLHHIDEIIGITTAYPSPTPGEVLKEYAQYKGGMISVTNVGRVMKVADNHVSECKVSDSYQKKLYNFGLCETMKAFGAVVVSTRGGDVCVVDIEKEEALLEVEGVVGANKVVAMFVAYANDKYYVALDVPNPTVPLTVLEFTSATAYSIHKFTKPDIAVSAMAVVGNTLVIGGRKVTLAAYSLKDDSTMWMEKKVAAGDTITSISTMPSDLVLITVRDGVYLVASINSGLEIIHENKLSRGFIEGGYWDNNTNHLILYGFKSQYFYIWDETSHCELMAHQCGGVHRKWSIYKCGSSWQFVFVNKSTVYVRQFTPRGSGLLHRGTHGREIRDVAINKTAGVVVTASEDATVKFSRFNGDIIDQWTMNNHVSGLQRCKFLGDDFVASSAANEEFIVWKLDHRGPVVMVKEWVRLPPAADIPDLRIMDFDSVDLGDNRFLISTVYSDSNIKVWTFDATNKTFTLESSVYYRSCCILNVQFIKLGSPYLMIAATDGHIAVWKMEDTKLSEMIIRQQIHQNGIKDWHVEQREDEVLLYTGGDDNALGLSRLSGDIHWESLAFVADAASSTITGVCGISPRGVVVTSVDQIVRVWDDKLTCEAATYTSVADTGCVDVLDGAAVVGGAGLTVFSLT